MKGVSVLVEAVVLMAIAVVLSSIVGGWLSTFSEEKTSSIENQTSTRLQCEFGRIFIKSATYNCANNCSAGINHTLNLSVANSGKIRINLDRMFIINTSGATSMLALNETVFLDPGVTKPLTNVSTETCGGINRTIDKIVVSSINCPSTTFSSISGSDVTFSSCG